jgi:predicted house-cleaning noncanonical NTP pyrophosphatase (MazG superfamily)
MKIDDRLSEVFDVNPIADLSNTKVIDSTTGEIVQSSGDKIQDDYDKSRGNLHDLLTQGQDALTHALSVAKQSEHPRAFEVVGNLMKQLADVNQQLMDLHQQKAKLDGPKAAKQEITNNAIFVGSTAELTKMIKSMNKGE